MKVAAFLGSPRVEGNSEILIGEAIGAIEKKGHRVELFRPHAMDISPCNNCGGCEETGKCVIEDDMGGVYDTIHACDRFLVVSPVFFFGLPSQIKALIDRCQAIWCEKYLLKRPIPEGPYGRKGLLVMVGGMKKEEGFKSCESTAK
ncbi:MAG: flavodoxin family protein, partial [Nitrospirae bacterium]|nr:flavodoxin family protein [Nitrospirota bacterium]